MRERILQLFIKVVLIKLFKFYFYRGKKLKVN